MIKLTLPQFDFLQKRLRKLSRRQTVALTIVVSSLILSGAIFAVAELGGYGQNGPAAAPNSLDYGLVGHWDMEEGSGQVVKDKSGNGNDGTLGTSSAVDASDPVFAPGHDSSGENGTGLKFDGVDDYVDAGSGSSLITNTITVSAWVKTNASSETKIIASKYDASANHGIVLIIAEDGKVEMDGRDGSGDYRTSGSSTTSIADNNWHYVTGSVSGSVWKINVDGRDENSADSGYVNTNLANSVSLMLGRVGFGYYFSGSIDEVRIYNRALSDDEIRQLYNQKKPVLEMKFDEGSGTVAHDESFNHNDGTISGATWTTGKNGGALAFDGVDDYVDAGNGSSLNNTGTSFTVESWFYTPTDLSNQANTYPVFVNKSDWANNAGWALQYDKNIGRIILNAKNASGWIGMYSARTSFPAGWYHFVGAFYSDGTQKLYINGSLDNTGYGFPANANGADLIIGNNFNGSIDNVRIYNYARTADEVLSDYNDGMAAHLGKNNQDLNRGLVGHWDMEEGSGQTVYDKSGNGNNGTLGANTAVAADDPVFASGHDSSGENGTGLNLDGQYNFVKIDNGGGDFNLSPRLSFGMWVKFDNFNQRQFLVSNGDDWSSGSYSGFQFLLNSGGATWAMYITQDSTITANVEFADSIEANKWYYIALTYDQGAVKFYRDGILKGSSSSVPAIAYTKSCILELGSFSDCGGTSSPWWTLDGSIDDVRIYNRALSDDEIRLLYNQKKPVLEMKFDEGSGTVAHDESFNHNDGTISGATWTEGKNGGALAFDGVDDYVDAGNRSDLNITNQVTIGAWLKSSQKTQGMIAGKVNSAWNGGWWLRAIATDGADPSDKGICFGISKGVDWFYNEVCTNASYIDGSWHYYSGFYDGTNIKIFMDGVLKASSSVVTPTMVSDQDVFVGYNNVDHNYFNGSLDNVRIYNYARTADEVLSDYNDGMAAHLGKNNQDLNRGLVGHWDMEEGSGQTVYDKSGNGNNGTLGADTAVAADDPVFAPGHDSSGENGTGLKFDGVDDYVNAGSGSSLGASGALTISTWIKIDDYSAGEAIVVSKYNSYGLDIRPKTGMVHFDLWEAGEIRRWNYTGENRLPTSGWIHIVATYADNVAKIYINGVPENIVDQTNGALNVATNNLYIGEAIDGVSGAIPFPGSIDDVRIYNRALSDDEIRQLYNQKKPVLEMKFDEGSGTVAHDESFNHNDGTISGATWTTGKFGSAISLTNGSCVDAGSGASLNLPQALSISVWIYPTAEYVGYAAHSISKNTSLADANFVLYYFGTTSGINRRLMFYGTRDGVWGNLSDSYEVSLNTWYHIELVYNSLQGGLLYVNGNRVGGYSGGGVLATNNVSLVIGNDFPGSIDNLLIYNYARTADEVLTDYNNGLAAHLR
ncbi:MAG: LamG domain-containing protein [Patescibacteria group bacterium]